MNNIFTSSPSNANLNNQRLHAYMKIINLTLDRLLSKYLTECDTDLKPIVHFMEI